MVQDASAAMARWTKAGDGLDPQPLCTQAGRRYEAYTPEQGTELINNNVSHLVFEGVGGPRETAFNHCWRVCVDGTANPLMLLAGPAGKQSTDATTGKLIVIADPTKPAHLRYPYSGQRVVCQTAHSTPSQSHMLLTAASEGVSKYCPYDPLGGPATMGRGYHPLCTDSQTFLGGCGGNSNAPDHCNSGTSVTGSAEIVPAAADMKVTERSVAMYMTMGLDRNTDPVGYASLEGPNNFQAAAAILGGDYETCAGALAWDNQADALYATAGNAEAANITAFHYSAYTQFLKCLDSMMDARQCTNRMMLDTKLSLINTINYFEGGMSPQYCDINAGGTTASGKEACYKANLHDGVNPTDAVPHNWSSSAFRFALMLFGSTATLSNGDPRFQDAAGNVTSPMFPGTLSHEHMYSQPLATGDAATMTRAAVLSNRMFGCESWMREKSFSSTGGPSAGPSTPSSTQVPMWMPASALPVGKEWLTPLHTEDPTPGFKFPFQPAVLPGDIQPDAANGRSNPNEAPVPTVVATASVSQIIEGPSFQVHITAVEDYYEAPRPQDKEETKPRLTPGTPLEPKDSDNDISNSVGTLSDPKLATNELRQGVTTNSRNSSAGLFKTEEESIPGSGVASTGSQNPGDFPTAVIIGSTKLPPAELDCSGISTAPNGVGINLTAECEFILPNGSPEESPNPAAVHPVNWLADFDLLKSLETTVPVFLQPYYKNPVPGFFQVGAPTTGIETDGDCNLSSYNRFDPNHCAYKMAKNKSMMAAGFWANGYRQTFSALHLALVSLAKAPVRGDASTKNKESDAEKAVVINLSGSPQDVECLQRNWADSQNGAPFDYSALDASTKGAYCFNCWAEILGALDCAWQGGDPSQTEGCSDFSNPNYGNRIELIINAVNDDNEGINEFCGDWNFALELKKMTGSDPDTGTRGSERFPYLHVNFVQSPLELPQTANITAFLKESLRSR